MLTVEPTRYFELIDLVRRSNASCTTNIFVNAHELLDTLKKQKTFMLRQDNQALFIFVRYNDTYYDLLYICASETYEKLAETTSFLNFIKKLDLPVRVGITGTYDKINTESIIFEQCGFIRNKTVGKITFNARKNEYAEHFVNTAIAQSPESDDMDNLVITFPDVSDAKEIFDLLCEEFDLIDDSVPGPDEIAEDIKKKFVAVIKKNDRIIAVNYYRIKNRIRSCIYEYVRKEFRTNGTMFLLNNFVNKHIAEHENVIRTYGWRDVTKKRLINVYRALGETFCNVYTTYLLFRNE